MQATQAEIAVLIGSAMLLRNDVIDLERQDWMLFAAIDSIRKSAAPDAECALAFGRESHECVFRTNPTSDFAANRPAVSLDSGQRFRSIPAPLV